MRFLHFLLFSLVAVSVTSAQREAAPSAGCVSPCMTPPVYEGICEHPPSIGWGFSEALEQKCISQTGSSAARDGDRLQLKFRDGTTRFYRDSLKEACDEDQRNCVEYMLYDYFREHELFLIRVMYCEADEWRLIRQLNGAEEQIVGPPRYSPDRKWLAAVHWSEGAPAPRGPDDNGNNGIDIVPSAFDPALQSFHYRPENYAFFEFVRWNGNEGLATKVTVEVITHPSAAL
jgi:hypothetical protein